MDFLKTLVILLLVAGASGCRKKSASVEKEVREAGYEMTAEGWFDAVRENDVAVMRKMVEGGFDAKTLTSDGKGGLHIAAMAGSEGAGEYLLDRGHSVDKTGTDGRTPLMEAVLTDRPEMVKWLLGQGADPGIKDSSGFTALMLAASEGKSASVEELAPYNRDDLDSALLVASLVGKPEVIDVLTNYGASVHARMADGRTPMMLAAENGHAEAVALLIDIGASRFSTTETGDTARSLAVAAGHGEIAAMIESGFTGDSLAFETDEQVAEAMEEYVEEFEAAPEGDDEQTAMNGEPGSQDALAVASEAGMAGNPPPAGNGSQGDSERSPVTEARGENASPPQGTGRSVERVGRTLRTVPGTLAGARIGKPKAAPAEDGSESPESESVSEIPLVMRHYRQRELPVEVREVSGDVASLRIVRPEAREIQVKAGEAIPDSSLMVVKVFTRTEQGKLNENKPVDVGIVEVEDTDSGQRREWMAGMPASGHDPVALVEDAATGRRYIARPGQNFTSEDGREFVVNDVRPGQIIIEDTGSGETRTLRLRGPRG